MADEKHLNEPAIVGPASVPVIVAIPAHIAQALGITNGSLIDIRLRVGGAEHLEL